MQVLPDTSALLALDSEAQDLLFREAHTTYTFADEPVTDEQVRAIYDLVRWAPTAVNGQPLRVLLVRSGDARQRLVPFMMDSNQGKVATAPLVAVLAYDTDFHENLPRLLPHAPGAKDWFAQEAPRVASAHENAALQAAYFLLGVRAAGLGAGPMSGFDASGVDAEFLADTSWRSFMVVTLGVPAEEGAWHPRSPRMDYEEVFHEV
ncbi:malonic semialdehyde reductase [Rubricoccus marinus]|uniref:Malonic semialdehyde reductase n=1 Tax=Rubricoccus marinus TaxID=716817 RepID=A0A259U1Y3_9BACT|nr:malonic semialdehyde reductase [Rubricoccus marinus]OZC03950.1 malonic semialdehyde reductase [Rubricoccus marinus]